MSAAQMVNSFQASVAMRQGRTVRGRLPGSPAGLQVAGFGIRLRSDDLGYLVMRKGNEALFRTEGCLLHSDKDAAFVVFDALPVAPEGPSPPNRRYNDEVRNRGSVWWDNRYVMWRDSIRREFPDSYPTEVKEAWLDALDCITLHGLFEDINWQMRYDGQEPYRNVSHLAYAILVGEIRGKTETERFMR